MGGDRLLRPHGAKRRVRPSFNVDHRRKDGDHGILTGEMDHQFANLSPRSRLGKGRRLRQPNPRFVAERGIPGFDTLLIEGNFR